MRTGRRASSSSESEENRHRRSEDPPHRPPERGEGSSSESDAEVRHGMKRSQRFCSSFSFGEDRRSRDGDDGEHSPKGSNGQAVEAGQSEDLFPAAPPPRSCLFRPQDLWLAVTRCLSLRWPPCLTLGGRSSVKLAYRADQSEEAGSPDGSTNGSSLWTSSPDEAGANQSGEEIEVRVLPAPRRGISCTTSRLARVRQAPDPALASMILEKETFLRVELVDSGEEREDARYWAEWKLSDRARELAGGVWLSKSRKTSD